MTNFISTANYIAYKTCSFLFIDCLECPEKFSTRCVNHGKKCFLMFCGVLDWYEAHRLCYMVDGRLAIINDSTTMAAVTKGIQSRKRECTQYWIGIARFRWNFMNGLNKGIVK